MEKKINILGLDFETQDADAKTTRATEVGAVLYEYVPSSRPRSLTEIRRYSSLIWDKMYPPQTEKIVELTGITDEMLVRDGRSPILVFTELQKLISSADVIVIHKVSFDRTVLETHLKKLGLPLPEKEYLCTLTNFPWPTKFTCKKLSHLAYEHGILVDPRTLHRAVNDVELMMRLISSEYDMEQILAYARTPWIYVKAEVVPPWTDGGIQNGFAKTLGFSYEQVKGVEEHKWPKKWVTRVKTEEQFDGLVELARQFQSPFRVSRIEGIV